MKTIKIVFALTFTLMASTIYAQEQIPKIKEFGIGLSNLNSFSLQYRWGNEKRIFRLNATIGGSTSFGKGSSNSNVLEDTTYNSNNNSGSKTSVPINFNTGISFSMLRLKKINDKFGLMCGPLAGLTYATSSSQTTSTGTRVTNYNYNNPSQIGTYPTNETTKSHSISMQPYIGFVLGAYFKINASFLLYAEIAPNVYYAQTNTSSNSTQVNSSPTHTITENGNSTNKNNSFGVSSLSNSGALLTIVYRITKK